MERIEEQHLRNIIGIGVKQNPSRDETALRCFLATALLRHYLGSSWCDECVKPGQTDVPRGSRAGRLFLRTDNDGSEDGHRHQERVERLAELLHNLQDVEGIAGRRASIQEGAVESTYAELEFAGHFIRHGVRVRFLDRSGVKGNDYDFDAGEGAAAVCCEVKCKLESTDPGSPRPTTASGGLVDRSGVPVSPLRSSTPRSGFAVRLWPRRWCGVRPVAVATGSVVTGAGRVPFGDGSWHSLTHREARADRTGI